MAKGSKQVAKRTPSRASTRVQGRVENRVQTRTLALMKQVQYRCYLKLDSALAPVGVAAVQYRILATLKARGKVSSAQLSRLHDVKPQTMFKQITMLRTKGLIRRSASKANKRVLEVELSEKGEAALTECDARAATLEIELFNEFSTGELALFRELMMRMLKAARAATRAPGATDKT